MDDKRIIEEIKQRNDIVELISSYVNLKRAGSNYVGLCPFHSERSPSFTVFPTDGHYYCFGCGAGGDAITFVRSAENLEFEAAVEFLARRVGITMPEREAKRGGIDKRRIFEMNRAAARYFRECLLDEKTGAVGREYLITKRALSQATISHFGLGFAPDSFGNLMSYLKTLGYTEAEMISGFLCKISQKSGKPYDLFRNRVIFPIIDVSGNVIAFGGRVMDDSVPKYLNSSDTPAFKKSRNLFALNFARGACEKELILCEGYMDVIALHAAGFTNAVATLGTAITPEQARIMSKYTKRVIITYDSDEAGQRAANKAIALLTEVGLEVRVLKLKGAKDPDEFIKKFGADKFREQLDLSKSKFNFNLDAILAKYDIKKPDDRIKACAAIAEIIAAMPGAAERDVYIRESAKILEISADSIKADINRIISRKKREYKKEENRAVLRKSAGFDDRVNPDFIKNVAAAKAEETILGLLLLYPEHRKLLIDGDIDLSPDDFVTEFGKKIFMKIFELEESGEFDFSILCQFFSPQEIGRMTKMEYARRILSDNGRDVLEESVNILKAESKKANGDDIQGIADIINKKRNK